MRELLCAAAFVCVLSACHRADVAPPAAPAPPPPPPAPIAQLVDVVPGVSVGPIKLGMQRAEIDALHLLRPHPRWRGRTVPYGVAYDEDGRVAIAQVSLLRAPADVRVGDVVLPRGTTFLRARELLGGDCTEPEIGFGGGAFSCRENRIEVIGGSGEPEEIWIGTHPKR